MIIQTFSLNDLKNKKISTTTDPYFNFRNMPYRNQLDEIQKAHHETERILMNKIISALELIITDNSSPEYTHFYNNFITTAQELNEHFNKEEQVVFPLMYIHDSYDRETIDHLNSMTNEHRDQENRNKSLQNYLHIFNAPCYSSLRRALQDFFTDVSIHITKEDEITFPNYIDLLTYSHG